jgi:hypothetical protein
LSGITFGFEAVIMFTFKSYNYYPLILPHKPLDDMALGNLFSQFSVTSSVLLFTFFDKKFYWYFMLAGIYSAIEELFIKLGVYSHNWYKTWMTFAGIVILCWVAKRVYKSILTGVRSSLLYTYMFFSFFNLYLITLVWIFKVLGIIDYNLSILRDAMLSYTMLSLSSMLIITIPCMVIYFAKLNWRWKSIIIVALYITFFIEYGMKIIVVKHGWLFIYPTLEIFITYIYVVMLDKLLKSSRVVPHP